MGKPTGFMEFERVDRVYKPVEERTKHWNEFVVPLADTELKNQAGRCMDCGIPFCHNGCPVNNQIPDWNNLVYSGDWKEAARNLHSTNNFPEVTGRICPAPCEAACTLNIDDKPVTIKSIEAAIADRAFQEGWVVPQPPSHKTGRRVAIVGSGPAGLAAAQQLARVGHDVHVYEKNAYPGGLLRYGIPDFKMEKHIVSRRVVQMEAEGVTFHCNTAVGPGADVSIDALTGLYDAVLLAGGSERPRDLAVPGRDLQGIHFAMDFLPQQNRRVSGEPLSNRATGEVAQARNVVVIGGGDTGSDCIGTSFRQGAKSVTQLEIMPLPPERENKDLTWPHWPLKMRTSSSQAEGANRDFSVNTKRFEGKDGRVTGLICVKVDERFKEVPGSEFEIKADLVLLAMGFVSPLTDGLGLDLDARGNVKADERHYVTSKPKLYVAGDMRRGQSLV
ncbi:MAG: glutamate synthase subunit beta, partial [Hyphomicrobium aestuarii]|nr:glutamate synthase subunit beta [Hyphomicrobium aestuarii]